MNLPEMLQDDDVLSEWPEWEKMDEKARSVLEDLSQWLGDLIQLIESDDLRAFTMYILSKSHAEWSTISPSSSGKYHPKGERGTSGTMHHLRSCMAFGMEGLRRYYGDVTLVDPVVRDELAFSILLHDWAVRGDPVTRKTAGTAPPWGQHTHKEHGFIAADIIEKEMLPRFLNVFSAHIKDEEELKSMVANAAFAIRNHYGIWTMPSFGGMKPDDPELTNLARLLQEADYYSTRAFLNEHDQELINNTFATSSPLKIARRK